MLNPASGSAQYTYDATGNIKSVVNNSLSTVTLLEFSPSAAPVGSTVTIAGTAFTTSGTSVSFNGTAATPSQVTSTSLTVTVPMGATTGPMTVTTPGGTATSVNSFTVSANAAPTITSFSPSTINPGQTLTINGSNFIGGGNTNYNKIFINNRFAEILTATMTKITVLVPNVGSGPVSVESPVGTGTATSPLYVAPSIPWSSASQCTPGPCVFTSQYSVASIVTAQTVTLPAQGSSVTAAIPAMSSTGASPPQVALVSFYAQAGQRIAISVPASLGQSTPATPVGLSVLGPDAWNSLPENDLPLVKGGGFQTLTLPVPIQQTGTHTVAVYIPSAVANPNGAGTIPNPCSPTSPCSIPATTLTLYNVLPDVTGTISASSGGTSLLVTFQGSGQSAQITFPQQTPSNLVSLLTTPSLTSADPNLPTVCYSITITQPELTNQSEFQCGRGSNAVDFSGQLANPVPGTYTISLTPLSPITTTGSSSTATPTLYSIASAFTPIAITIGGASKAVDMEVNGQNGILTFSGTSGQNLTLTTKLRADTIGQCAEVTVTYQSDQYTQTQVSQANQCSTTGGTQSFTIPATASYTITVAPEAVPTNSPPVPALKSTLTLALSSGGAAVPAAKSAATPATATPAITGKASFGGATMDLVIAKPGQSAITSFEGTADQNIEIAAGTDAAFGAQCFYVKTLAPDGTPLLDERSCDGTYSSGLLHLSASGTYQVMIRSDGNAVGGTWVHIGQPSSIKGDRS